MSALELNMTIVMDAFILNYDFCQTVKTMRANVIGN